MKLILLTILYIVVNLVWSNPIGEKHIKPGDLFTNPHVFLTVNSETGTDEYGNFLNRMIEINWYNIQVESNSSIALYNKNPVNINDSPNPIIRIIPTQTSGSVKTPVRFDVIDYHVTKMPEDRCMGYWVVYFTGNPKIPIGGINCLRVYPDWMDKLKEKIGNRPLSHLMIPGTHDSGAWKTYEGKIDDLNLISTYSRNQEDDIYTQLIHGIRFFDLRIGYYEETKEKFWINHGDFQMNPLMTVINDMKKFIKDSKEILLLDIHDFPVGFDDRVHEELIQLMVAELGDILYLRSSGLNPTLNEIWKNGKSAILSYTVNGITEKYDFIWPKIFHDWANTNSLEELREYFEREGSLPGCQNVSYAAMAEFTPTLGDMIIQPDLGLRGMAQIVNLPVTQWFRQENWYSRTNIVATDFYLGNNIVEMAYTVNSHSATCP